jgi:hypothetical protein
MLERLADALLLRLNVEFLPLRSQLSLPTPTDLEGVRPGS